MDIDGQQHFDECFNYLTGHEPFPWQRNLFGQLMTGAIPDVCDVPTGLGKTSVMAIWLLALGSSLNSPGKRTIPLRLVYVVDRRVIVDQATEEAEKIIQRLGESLDSGGSVPDSLRAIAQTIRDAAFSNGSLVALSTLRGQHADNREWCLDPSRPAILVGTVDMIGSRLLFSGYGKVGKNHRSLQAGLLGQDALIVIDEAHLSPAFVTLLEGVRREVRRFNEIKHLALMLLSATVRSENDGSIGENFGITEDDLTHPVARCRLMAEKKIAWVYAQQSNDLPASLKQKDDPVAKGMAKWATSYKENRKEVALVVYVKTVERANAVAALLADALDEGGEKRVLKLTGEMRGFERDSIPTHPVFQRFKPQQDRQLTDGPWFLVATSCAEVGVDLDADHGICDLSSMDSMIQRFGRINRFGNAAATITVVIDRVALEATEDDLRREREYENKVASVEDALVEAKQYAECLGAEAKTLKTKDAKDAAKAARDKAKQAEKAAKQIRAAGIDSNNKLEKTPRLDLTEYFTYLALKSLADENGEINCSPINLRTLQEPRAWPPAPVCPPLDESRIDDWSMPTLNQSEYRRPRVAYWLHGVIADETVQTTFCWRADLNYATSAERAEEMATTIPIAPRERAVLATFRAVDTLKELAKRSPSETAVIIDASGESTAGSLQALTEDKDSVFAALAYATVVLPTRVGGLGEDGNVIPKLSRQPDDVVDDQWTRYALSVGADGACDYGKLDRNGDIVELTSCDSLREALRICANKSGGICVNAKELQKAASELRDAKEQSGESEKRVILIAYFLNRKSPDHFLRADDDLSSLGIEPRTVDEHDADVERYARALVQKIGLDNETAEALSLSGAKHDRGKDREWWQAAIGNVTGKPLAKSTNSEFDHNLNQGYRHEFGSLVETEQDKVLLHHSDRDLILHLVASHHGYARPHFPTRAYDRKQPTAVNQRIAEEAMHRFARLQRKYGWWQLAYLEAMLKAADALASRDFSRGEL